ncbi:hypothetical protein NQ317_004027 [Molorchus minor]|nr:hypothetical protein NQ317_004027 [Molorchus minor]
MERRRQIALKALSERLSKSYSDKQPLIPKPNIKPSVPSNKLQEQPTAEESQTAPSPPHLQSNVPLSPPKSDT